MSITETVRANLEGIKSEIYSPVELPSGELGKANLIHSFRGRIILFQDDHSGSNYRKGLLKDSDNEVYHVEWLSNSGRTVSRRYHVNNLTGLMVQPL